MRDILFRGKRIDNGEWVEGFYYKMAETTYYLIWRSNGAFIEGSCYERNPGRQRN